jgi:hypothetical protein
MLSSSKRHDLEHRGLWLLSVMLLGILGGMSPTTAQPTGLVAAYSFDGQLAMLEPTDRETSPPN